MEVAGLHYVVNIIDVAYFSGLFNVSLRGLSVLESRDSKVATCDWHAGWRAFEPLCGDEKCRF